MWTNAIASHAHAHLHGRKLFVHLIYTTNIFFVLMQQQRTEWHIRRRLLTASRQNGKFFFFMFPEYARHTQTAERAQRRQRSRNERKIKINEHMHHGGTWGSGIHMVQFPGAPYNQLNVRHAKRGCPNKFILSTLFRLNKFKWEIKLKVYARQRGKSQI